MFTNIYSFMEEYFPCINVPKRMFNSKGCIQSIEILVPCLVEAQSVGETDEQRSLKYSEVKTITAIIMQRS